MAIRRFTPGMLDDIAKAFSKVNGIHSAKVSNYTYKELTIILDDGGKKLKVELKGPIKDG